jgi:hypothetical protein
MVPAFMSSHREGAKTGTFGVQGFSGESVYPCGFQRDWMIAKPCSRRRLQDVIGMQRPVCA